MSKMRILLNLTAVLLAPAAHCADVNRSWETLMDSLKVDRKVVVVQHSRKQAGGKVLSLTSESIAVEVNGQPVTVQREDVFRVRIADTRQKRTLIGLGAGAAAGVVFGSNLGSRRHGLSAVVFGGLFGGIGAAVGAAIQIGNPLYEAPGGLKKARK